MLEPLGLSLRELDEQLAVLARQLAAKAEREQMRYFQHQLLQPGRGFEPDDPVFCVSASSAGGETEPRSTDKVFQLETLPLPGMSLSTLIEGHVASMEDQGQGASHINEFRRVSRWLLEELGKDTPIGSICVAQARDFRDKLRRIDAARRSPVKDGEKTLADSLTDDRARQIKSETARRYWAYVGALFRRAVSEGHLAMDPAASLQVMLRRDEEVRSPEPYSTDELKVFFAMPVFSGAQSRARRKEPGNYLVRDGHWWSGLIQAYTGMRGGELSQLFPSDFVFDAEMPHILIRKEDGAGNPTKQVKNSASKRAIPISNDLLILGLREFVERRAKKHPGSRLFREFPLGTGGKVSDGLSKFWRRYIVAFGLHKPGRAIHVWRHSVIYHLRARGVPEEDIGYLVGHSTGSQTARYGAGELLARVKDRSLAHLDYGFSVVDAVGGPFDPKRHGE